MNEAKRKDTAQTNYSPQNEIENNDVVSWERVVPDKLDTAVTFQRRILEQHIERYKFAGQFVKNKSVVDAACGVGYGSEILLQSGAKQVLGLDLDQNTVDYARTRYATNGISFEVADLNTYPLDSLLKRQTKIDVFVSFETVEHLDNPRAFLKKIAAILPPDGLFIASVPTVPTVDIDEFHKHDFSENSWRALVRSCGFEIMDALPQKYRASISELAAESKAKNTTDGARRNRTSYYLRHPIRFILRYTKLFLFGLDLDMLTLVCRPNPK